MKQSIPGCEEIEKLSDTEMTAKVIAKVGPVSAAFGGKVTLSDLDPPNGYKITGEGTGGAAGFAKGGATVRLVEDGDAHDAHLRGRGACRRQAGADRLAPDRRDRAQDGGRFLRPLRRPDGAGGNRPAEPTRVAAVAPAAAEAGAPAPTGRGTRAPNRPPPRHRPEAPPARPAPSFRLPPVVWVAGLAVVVALVLYYFTRHGGSG